MTGKRKGRKTERKNRGTHILEPLIILTLSVLDSMGKGDGVVGRHQRIRRHRVWPRRKLLRDMELDAGRRNAISRTKCARHIAVCVSQQLRSRALPWHTCYSASTPTAAVWLVYLQPAQRTEAQTWVESTRPTRPKHVTAAAAIAAAREAGESFTISAPTGSATKTRRRAKREVGFYKIKTCSSSPPTCRCGHIADI